MKPFVLKACGLEKHHIAQADFFSDTNLALIIVSSEVADNAPLPVAGVVILMSTEIEFLLQRPGSYSYCEPLHRSAQH